MVARLDGSATAFVFQRFVAPEVSAALLLEPRHFSSQDRDRSLRQSKRSLRIGRHNRRDWRMIRVCMTVGAVVNPHILLAPESHERDRSGKRSILFAPGILELYSHRVWIGLVAVHQHQRPVSVGTMHRIRSNQRIALGESCNQQRKKGTYDARPSDAAPTPG